MVLLRDRVLPKAQHATVVKPSFLDVETRINRKCKKHFISDITNCSNTTAKDYSYNGLSMRSAKLGESMIKRIRSSARRT